jgi:ubiquinone/menaquinone biosynthesis C-methylase UbiE
MRQTRAAAGFDGEQVRRFYDDNTRLFLSLGQGTEGTIRRAVWGPGVATRVEAMAYVDQLVMQRISSLAGAGPEQVPAVVDLGCGVCASLCRIAKHMPIRGTGVTISPAQVELARQRIERAGLSASVRSIQADFCQLPVDLPPADLAFGIESFVHASSGAAFFRESAKLIRPGGYLIVCDDFLSRAALRAEPPASRWISRFSKGWRAGNLLAADEASELATAAGFSHVETLDLSAYLEIRRPRDYAMGALMRCFGWLPIESSYWSMLYGGHAVQLCLERGWIKHLLMVWPRDREAPAPAE